MPRSMALGSGGDPLIWLGLAAATLFFVATGAVAYLNFQQTVRKLQELSIEWRKERAGRNFNRFRPNWPSDAT